jgi:transmembrane sensor
MTERNYNSYTADDFLNDQDFLRYIKHNHPEDVAFWRDWQGRSPENLQSFAAARLQLEVILSAEALPVPMHFQANLLQSINDTINTVEKAKKQKSFRLQVFSGIAASLIIGLFISWYFVSSIVIHADYATPKLVHLPDGSEVQLNANSTLTYARAFNWKSRREVKLVGEAYFKVKHLNQTPDQLKKGDVFIASTKSVLIQVLGTEFNVKERHDEADITLVKGKVKVTSVRTGSQFIMKPGDVINFDQQGDRLLAEAMVDNKLAWLSGKLIVNQTTVNTILREFSDLYGYQVILDNPALGQKKIDGAISIKSEESLLFTLKNILNVDIEKDGRKIYLKSRK